MSGEVNMSARARLRVAIVLAALLVAATAALGAAAWLSYDPNRPTAERVVRDAGVPANVTPGPGDPR